MRYLLDTNIISNFTKPAPSDSLIAWMAEQLDEDLFITSLTVAEIRRGVLEMPVGKRRDQLDACSPAPRALRRFSPAAFSRSTRMPVSSGRG